MTKSNKKHIDEWRDVIGKSWENQRKVDNKLTPSKLQINSIVDFSRNINETTQLIKNASDMAHEGLIDFEIAQKIINTQKNNIENDIKYLKSYLEINEEGLND